MPQTEAAARVWRIGWEGACGLAATQILLAAFAPELCLVLCPRPLPTLRRERGRVGRGRGGGAPTGASNHCPRHKSKRCRLHALRARKRTQRGALASRRSTAALAKAFTSSLSFGPRFLEKPGANGLPALPGPGAASSSQPGRSARRAGSRSCPGAGLRAPPAGTALAPLQGSSREASLDDSMSEMSVL
jgi:hypothetical protein